MRLGLLGGSFDPTHSGHVLVSLNAIKLLGLHQLWWIVSKQNPLKQKHFYSLEERVKKAIHAIGSNKKIKVLSSKKLHTYDDIYHIINKYPQYNFTWIMGLDNAINFHKWYKHDKINNLICINILNRDKLILKAQKSKFIVHFAKNQRHNLNSNSLLTKKQFSLIKTKTYPISSTLIR